MNYELKSDLDGFYTLYSNDEELFQVHDDQISADDYEDRLAYVVQMFEAHNC